MNKPCPGSKIKSGGAGRGLGIGQGKGPLRKKAANVLRRKVASNK